MAMPTIDPLSAELVLEYTDEPDEDQVGGRSARNAPPRDLSHGDVARLAYVEALSKVAQDVGQPVRDDDGEPTDEVITRPDPREPDPELTAAILTELVDSGYYKLATAKAKKAAAEAAPPPPPPTTAAGGTGSSEPGVNP